MLRAQCAFGLLATLAAVSPLAAAKPPSVPGPPSAPQLTVTVDCDAGDSLGEALAARADSLTVEFTGTCQEDLTIDRDRVTLRGLDPSAVLEGASDPAFLSAIEATGADLVLEGFTITGSDGRGIRVRRSGGLTLTGMTVSGNAVSGLELEESSSARVTDSTFNDNGFAGLAAFSSSLTVSGAIEASGNGLIGVFLSTNATIENVRSEPFVTDDNGLAGVVVQLESTGQFPPVHASGNGFAGIWVLGGKFFGVRINISNNANGVVVGLGGLFEGAGVIADNDGVALRTDHRCQASFNDSLIRGDVVMDGTLGDLLRDTIEGDVTLTFGSHVALTGSTADNLFCDETVLVRGLACSPLPLTGGGTSSFIGGGPQVPRTPAGYIRKPD